MKIDSATIGMESARNYQSVRTTTRRFRITEYQAALAGNGNALYADVHQGNDEVAQGDQDGEKQEGNAGQTQALGTSDWQNRFGISTARINMRTPQESVISELKQLTFRYIFDLLFTRKRGFHSESENPYLSGTDQTGQDAGNTAAWQAKMTGSNFIAGSTVYAQGIVSIHQVTNPAANMRALNFTAESYERETEETSFSTVGHVRTTDGREIPFNIRVGMSRNFEKYYSQESTLTVFNRCDPLVINLDTDAVKLEDQTFYFDIDADGEMDEISQLGAGSGYLALDKNGDGIINDGSELFGTSSGDGFRDLAQYDEDGNGWIDENDAVWSKLKIWTKDEQGRDVLCKLADKGVGAICLQNVETDFTMKGEDGRIKGAVRNSGVFLYESGNVGTIQHVDLNKYAMMA